MPSLTGYRCAALALAISSELVAGRLTAQEKEPPAASAKVTAPAKAEPSRPDLESLKQKATIEALQRENSRLQQELQDREKLSALQQVVKTLQGENRRLKQELEDKITARDPFGVRSQSSQEAIIRRQLGEPTIVECVQTPLQDVANYLEDYHKIEVRIDESALVDAGVSTDTPLTCNLRGVTLRSALRVILEQHNLDWIIRNEVLTITTRGAAQAHDELRSYNVADLVGPQSSVDDLADVVRAAVGQPQLNDRLAAPEAGESSPPADAPAPTLVMPFRNVLVVRLPQRRHEEVAELLRQPRIAVAQASAAEVNPEAGVAAPVNP